MLDEIGNAIPTPLNRTRRNQFEKQRDRRSTLGLAGVFLINSLAHQSKIFCLQSLGQSPLMS
jgi:hypothetical protein